MSNAKNKSTIFVRNLPPDTLRSELEDLFGDVGPIKKCSIIHDKKHDVGRGRGFGFVRFASEEDAELAASSQQYVLERDGMKKYKLLVEMASDQKLTEKDARNNVSQKEDKDISGEQKQEHRDQYTMRTPEEYEQIQRKRTARVIVRNLAFTAKVSNIQAVCEEFGTVVDVHVPTVGGDGRKQQHNRGFAFVTFSKAEEAKAAVEASAKGGVSIRNRQVAIDFSIPKSLHQQHRNEERNRTSKQKEDDAREEIEEGRSSGEEDSDSSSSDAESSSSDDENDSDDNEDKNRKTRGSNEYKQSNKVHPDDVDKQCTVFVRNIPFDADRHSIFMLFKKFGRIEGVYLVKDRATGVIKGTGFIKYSNKKSAQAAVKAGCTKEDAPFVSSKDATVNAIDSNSNIDDGIFFHGRRLLVDMAVDRNTAGTLRVERDEDGKAIKKAGKDRRNLYLKMEGYIGNDERNVDSWRNIPEVDKEKRARASTEKSTKLRSPLFFINPNRISVRNLAKGVDEASLKKLIVESIKEGLRKKLVTSDDISTQLRAQGLPPRECVNEAAAVPDFDEKDIRRFVPSVFIGRDVMSSSSTKTELGPSKGFAFVEFTFHAHALASLRELNNNPKYSKDYAVFGYKAWQAKKSKRKGNLAPGFFNEDGKLLVPRLIVDFTVSKFDYFFRIQHISYACFRSRIKQKPSNKLNDGNNNLPIT